MQPVEIQRRPGYDALWLWFGLERASWITLPRVLCHEMPDEWQAKMAALMEEYDAAFPNMPPVTSYVSIKKDGKFTSEYRWLNNYRYPKQAKINTLRKA